MDVFEQILDLDEEGEHDGDELGLEAEVHESDAVVLRRDPEFIPDDCPDEDDGEEIDESQAVELRRASMGTTVITGTETELGTEDDVYSDEESKLESEWTESQVGGGSDVVVYGS